MRETTLFPLPPTVPLADSREVLPCPHCQLVQFRTVSSMCRRCRKPLDLPQEQTTFAAQSDAASEDSHNVFQNFGKHLQYLRLELGLSQTELARRMQVPRTYLSKLENGKLSPHATKIETIARALGISAAELFDDKYSRSAKAQAAVLNDPLTAEILTYLPNLSDWQCAHILRVVREPWRLRNAS